MPIKNKHYSGKFIDLMMDTAFKSVFFKEENKHLFITLLNSIISDKVIVDITHQNTLRSGFFFRSKRPVFDLYCETDDGSKIIVELQIKKQNDFADRTIYYSSFPIQQQIKSGASGYAMSPIYVVSIINFCLPHETPDDRVIWSYSIREDENHELLSSSLHFIFVELEKFKKSIAELANNQDYALFCIKDGKALKEIPQQMMDTYMGDLLKAMQFEALSDRNKAKYLKEMLTKRDILGQIDYAKQEGLEEGIEKGYERGREEGREEGMELGKEKGRLEERLAVARNLKSMGLGPADIAAATGLGEDEVAAL